MKKIFLSLILFSALITTNEAICQTTLHIYGGQNHKVYLGCINCNKYDANSIWNAYGDFGSKYNSKSIWNRYAEYGGQYSSFSPFNSYTDTPPIVVDKEGNSYGYLTTNKYKTNRATFKLALTICDNWEAIKEDVSGSFDKIFQ